MRRFPPAFLFLLVLLAGPGQPAFAVKRDVIRQLQADYAGHTYQLRSDLLGTNYMLTPNVVDDRGIRYRGREASALFRQMETVYLDRVSKDGKRSVTLTIYRSRTDARQIRGSVPAVPLPVGPDRNTTLGSFARGLSTSVTLEVAAGADDQPAQREQIIGLLNRLFYLKEGPTYAEKETFIRSHADLPAPKLAEMTGLSEDVVRGILKREGSR